MNFNEFLEVPDHAKQEAYRHLSDDDKVKAITHLQARAEAEPGYTLKCLDGEKVIFVDDIKARAPGHIYSEMGSSEYRISHTCEWHFDLWLKEPDEDDEPDPGAYLRPDERNG